MSWTGFRDDGCDEMNMVGNDRVGAWIGRREQYAGEPRYQRYARFFQLALKDHGSSPAGGSKRAHREHTLRQTPSQESESG